MGQAKRRGTYEQRVRQSQKKEEEAYIKAKEEHDRRTKLQLEKTLAGPRRAGGRVGVHGMIMAAAVIAAGGMSMGGPRR